MAQEIRRRVERENITCMGCGQDKDYHIGETIPGTFGTARTDKGEAQDWYAYSDGCILAAVKAARGETASKANGHAKGQATGKRRGRPPASATPEIPSDMPALEATG